MYTYIIVNISNNLQSKRNLFNCYKCNSFIGLTIFAHVLEMVETFNLDWCQLFTMHFF